MNEHTALIQTIARNAGFATEVTKSGVAVFLTSRKVQMFEIEMVFEAIDAPVIIRRVNGQIVVS